MTLEAAMLQVRAAQAAQFEAAFEQASLIIAASPGYRWHRLERGIEAAGRYLLLVEWDTLESHSVH